MSDFYAINRYALLIRPSKEMIDWVNRVFPQDPVPYEDRMENDNTDVYLIPEMADMEDAQNWLKDNYLAFFENALDDWCTDEKLWPSELNWATFERFMEYTIQSNILDIVSEEEDEEYRDEDDDDDNPNGFAAERDEIDLI